MTARIVVLAPNWLGDAVMALPAIAALVDARPDTVDVAARPSVVSLFTMMPRLGRVVPLQSGQQGIHALEQGGYDAALLLPNSFNAAWLAHRARIPERWGYRTGFRGPLLTRAVTPPARLHQVEYLRDLVEALGFPCGSRDPHLDVPPPLRETGARLLAGEGWDGRSPLVAIAPGAAFGGAKRWPASSFAALASRLAADGVRAVLIGSGADRVVGRELLASLSHGTRPIDLIGRTDLPMLAAVLVQCQSLVTNDSGAMHVAAALGVNVTALIGPTREQETRPRGEGRHAVLTHAVWCRPCMLRECPLTHRCMTGITVDAALTATRARL